jgi:hypothetical protein
MKPACPCQGVSDASLLNNCLLGQPRPSAGPQHAWSGGVAFWRPECAPRTSAPNDLGVVTAQCSGRPLQWSQPTDGSLGHIGAAGTARSAIAYALWRRGRRGGLRHRQKYAVGARVPVPLGSHVLTPGIARAQCLSAGAGGAAARPPASRDWRCAAAAVHCEAHGSGPPRTGYGYVLVWQAWATGGLAGRHRRRVGVAASSNRSLAASCAARPLHDPQSTHRGIVPGSNAHCTSAVCNPRLFETLSRIPTQCINLNSERAQRNAAPASASLSLPAATH